jgi:hypothetical protein
MECTDFYNPTREFEVALFDSSAGGTGTEQKVEVQSYCRVRKAS